MDAPQHTDATLYRFEDFTEEHYAELLALAKQRYTFERFGTTSAAPHVIWRHDVDFSPHRALRLAQLETAAGVRATYFILLHSEFYNVLEGAVRDKILEIVALGHRIGLHFELAFHGRSFSRAEVEAALSFERGLLARVLSTDVEAFSFHNPAIGNAHQYDDDVLAGMVNVYGRSVKQQYRYCSDSHGYWRFGRLKDILSEPSTANLHVLTHPEWWTPSAMSPRDRVSRCIEGRAQSTERFYDDILKTNGWVNVR